MQAMMPAFFCLFFVHHAVVNHAGTGLKELNGKVNEIDAENMLGEDD